MAFLTWSALMAHLDALGLFHMDMRLDRMERAVSRLGLRVPFCPAVQFVGTNGKGSSSAFLDALAQAHGLHTGLYTSPHLAHITERIRIDGHPLAQEAWPELASAVYAAAPDLTHFEFLTCLAMLAFAQAGVDCIILEAGLGGRFDATSALPVDLVAFTPIALDHCAVLGADIASIAADKAHAMRPGRPVVSAVQSLEVMDCLRTMAAARDCPLHWAPSVPCVYEPSPCGKRDVVSPRLGLDGVHQQGNAALALSVWRTLAQAKGWPSTPEAELAGLAAAFIPGRLQQIGACAAHPALVLDGAHNPHGLEQLEQSLRAAGIRPRALIFTCLADKDADTILSILVRIARGVPIYVPDMPHNPRARSATELAAQLVDAGADAHSYPHIDAALAAAFAQGDAQNDRDSGSEPVLICGSLYMLGELFARYPAYLEP